MSTTVENLLYQVLGSLADFRAETKLRFEGVESRLGTLEEDVSSIKVKIQNMDNKIQSMDDKIQSMDDKIQSMDDKIQSMDDKIQSMDTHIQDLDTKFDNLQITMAEGFMSLGDRIFDVRTGLDAVLRESPVVVPKNLVYKPWTP